MITVNTGPKNKIEDLKNIFNNEAIVELLKDKNVNEITLRLSPEVLKELQQKTMDQLIEDAPKRSVVIVKSKIQIEGKIMDCEIISEI